MSSYEHCNHEKFKMRYHIIFSTKYRRKLLGPIIDDIKASMKRAEAMQDKWSIEVMEVDVQKCDHIHFLIRATPTCQISEIIHKLKQVSTYDMWQKHNQYLSKFYWSGKHYLWTRGYFCTSIGDVSEKTLQAYIENQGQYVGNSYSTLKGWNLSCQCLCKISEKTKIKYSFDLSIDGVTKESFESIRRGAKFEQIIKTAYLLKNYFDTQINFTIKKPNIGDIDKVSDFFKDFRLFQSYDYYDPECAKYLKNKWGE